MLPSNRETRRLSDTWIKMDALYFLQCSVREQGETGEGAEKGSRRKNGHVHARGHYGKYSNRVVGTGGSQSAYATRSSHSGKNKDINPDAQPTALR